VRLDNPEGSGQVLSGFEALVFLFVKVFSTVFISPPSSHKVNNPIGQFGFHYRKQAPLGAI
jgi:hypothetical protein